MGLLEDLRAAEEREAGALADRATDLGAAALTPSTVLVARLAVELVQRDDRRGALAEPAADLRALRTDSRLVTVLEGDLQKAGATALALIVEGLRKGYETDLHGRAAATESQATGLTLTVDVTASDLADIASYPILGHAPREIARHLVEQLRYDVEGALAAPLTGKIDPALVPAALGDVGRVHGGRVGSAVREAYFAGTQAATKAITDALVGGG